MITAIDIAWAAGFIEGEGTFYGKDKGNNGGGCTVTMSASQVQREPLERLQKLFGGNISPPQRAHERRRPIHRWSLSGSRAAGAAMTVLPLLSPRRFDQAVAMINVWKSARGHRNSQKTHCPQGHEYSIDNLYTRGKWRICRACTLARMERRNAARRAANARPTVSVIAAP